MKKVLKILSLLHNLLNILGDRMENTLKLNKKRRFEKKN